MICLRRQTMIRHRYWTIFFREGLCCQLFKATELYIVLFRLFQEFNGSRNNAEMAQNSRIKSNNSSQNTPNLLA